MNLGKLIDSLLRRHTSVYVKGLGVFKRVYTPATFDSKRNVFLPPISLIEFDHFETQGYDFLTYLQQLEHLEAVEAQLKLNNTIAGLMDKIHQNGEVVLENLGTLVSYGNSFVFKPLDLSGFHYTAISDDQTESVSAVTTHDILKEESLTDSNEQLIVDKQNVDLTAPVEQAAEEDIAISENNSLEQSSNAVQPEMYEAAENNHQPAKRSNAGIFGLIAIIAIFILGGLYYYSTFESYSPVIEPSAVMEVPVIDSISSNTDSVGQYTDLPVDSSSLVVKDSLPEVVSEKIIVDNNKYIIIIGTHPTLELANAQAQSFNKKGHKTVRVLEPNLSKNKKRVIWDSYPTRELRDSAMREVRKHFKEDAWGTEIK